MSLNEREEMKSVIRFFVLVLFSCGTQAALAEAKQEVAPTVVLPGLPTPLTVVNAPLDISVSSDGSLTIKAPGRTNLFNYPATDGSVHNAPMALFVPGEEFTLVAKVAAPLKNVYDVAAFVVYENEHAWAKFCYENSSDRIPTVVSVVTMGSSDDCNSAPVVGGAVYYAMCRRGAEYAFHYSTDGVRWTLVRHFHLETKTPVRVGFAVHAYMADPITGTFSEIAYKTSAPRNLRSFSR
jgi:regulation of enolase protein 1 (concanavalin A-like superfamily)